MAERTDAGRILVVSGPSGVGKSTICEALVACDATVRLVTSTTRPRRQGEQDGVDYHFVDRQEFLRRVAAGAFIEHAEVFGQLYGSPKGPADAALREGRCLLLNIDIQGAESLRRSGYPVVTLFILPPSLEELEKRLRARATDSETVITRRLSEARDEISCWDHFDHLVVNDDVAKVTARVLDLIARSGRLEGAADG
jgi:guanylate kinase